MWQCSRLGLGAQHFLRKRCKVGALPARRADCVLNSGCPAWNWAKVLEFAHQHGFSAIELRGLEGNLDLPSHPVFAAGRIEQTKREIREKRLKISLCQQFGESVF